MPRRSRDQAPPHGHRPPARRARPGQELGPCGLCGRPMVGGPSVDRHHLVPRSQGGTEAVWMHQICHRKVHSVLDEKTLARHYSTFEQLLGHPEIATFVRWVKKKDPEFRSRHARPTGRG